MAEMDQTFLLGGFLKKKRTATVRADTGHWPRPQYKFTVWKSITAIKSPTSLRSPLDDLTFPTFGAGYTCGLLLDISAFGIVSASHELSEASLFDYQGRATFRTRFRYEEVLIHFSIPSAIHSSRVLAFGMVRTGKENSVGPFSWDHRTPAFFARLVRF